MSGYIGIGVSHQKTILTARTSLDTEWSLGWLGTVFVLSVVTWEGHENQHNDPAD